MKEYYIHESCQIKDLGKIYFDIFGYKNNGIFIDVGAYDGFQHSNTWGLAHAGWEGICYEPVPQYFERCKENHSMHPRIKCLQTCVGDRKGYITLNVAGTISTCSPQQLLTEFWKNDYEASTPILSPIITLDETLKENCVNPYFDVLSLDVEGFETEVLKFFTIDYWKPTMAIVEAQEMHEAKELSLQAPFINKYFEDANYEKIYCDAINNIYIRKNI